METVSSAVLTNCTPHDIKVYDESKSEVMATYPRSEYQARLAEMPQEQLNSLMTPDGKSIPVVGPQRFKEVTGLPPSKNVEHPDILVSMLVGQKLQETGQWTGSVYGPDTGKGAVRDESGRIKGTVRLIKYC